MTAGGSWLGSGQERLGVLGKAEASAAEVEGRRQREGRTVVGPSGTVPLRPLYDS